MRGGELGPADCKQHPVELLRRLHALPDDGHAIKLARAVEVCRAVTEPYRDRDWLKVRGDDVYDKVLHVVLDSVESAGPKWVRSAGFKEAWKVGCRDGLGAAWGRAWLTGLIGCSGSQGSCFVVR